MGQGTAQGPRQLSSPNVLEEAGAARCGPRSKAHPVQGAVLLSDPSSGGGGGGEVGEGLRQEVEETKPGLPYPKAQCPAISPGLRLGPEPGASFCSLGAPPGRGDGIQGTPALAAAVCSGAGGCRGALRRWPGLRESWRGEREEGSREGEEEPAGSLPPGRGRGGPAEEEREQGQEGPPS